MAFERSTIGPATKSDLSDAAVAGPTIRAITTPTPGVIGQHDNLLIDTGLGETDTHDTVRRVSSGIGANFEFAVIPDAGHMLTIQRNARVTYAAIDEWLTTQQ
jgi:hypothetical protein